MIVKSLQAPYYAVIFTTILKNDIFGYIEMANKMEELAKKQAGYLGIESARANIGITVSYWKDEASILAWKNNMEHQEAKKLGKEKWYKMYRLRICKVEREYGFEV